MTRLGDRKLKELEVYLGAIDRKIGSAIEIDQLLLLTAELIKNRIEKMRSNEKLEIINTDLNVITSKCIECGSVHHQIVDLLRHLRSELRMKESKKKRATNSNSVSRGKRGR